MRNALSGMSGPFRVGPITFGAAVSGGEKQGETDATTVSGPPQEELVQLFTRSQRRLYLHILAQLGNPVDAEEALQETNLVIWRKSDQYRPGTNFLAWACQIANFEVKKLRERRGRDRLYFSDEFVQRISEETPGTGEEFEERRRALNECLRRLRPKDRELIQRRYAPGENGRSVAEFLGRPANSVYQSLGRIRRTLLECIRRRLAAESM